MPTPDLARDACHPHSLQDTSQPSSPYTNTTRGTSAASDVHSLASSAVDSSDLVLSALGVAWPLATIQPRSDSMGTMQTSQLVSPSSQTACDHLSNPEHTLNLLLNQDSAVELLNDDKDSFIEKIASLMEQEHGAASIKQDKSALAKFNKFLRRHVSRNMYLDALHAQDVDMDVLGKFTSFLLQDTAIKWQTSMNYLSSIKRQLETATGTLFFSQNESLYQRLRRTLNKQYVLQAMKEEKGLKDQAPAMTLSDLRAIGKLSFCPMIGRR